MGPSNPEEIAVQEARTQEIRIIQKHSRQQGRLDLASEVKELLRSVILGKEMPSARPVTPEEQAVWDLVNGFSKRMGATVQEIGEGHS